MPAVASPSNTRASSTPSAMSWRICGTSTTVPGSNPSTWKYWTTPGGRGSTVQGSSRRVNGPNWISSRTGAFMEPGVATPPVPEVDPLSPPDADSRPRFALVLGSGGVRGIAHLGVLRRLIAEGLLPDALVGCSAGSLIAAFYAAAGIEAEELVHYGTSMTARHLVAYGLLLRRFPRVWKSARARCEWITERLSLLDRRSVDHLSF